MPTKRRRKGNRQIGIPASAVEAWRAGDFHGLAAALGIRPWQMSPWPLRLTPLGCDPSRPPAENVSPWAASWQRAVELQRALIAAAGGPPAKLEG